MARKLERKEQGSTADATGSGGKSGHSKAEAPRRSKLSTAARWIRTIIVSVVVLVVLGAAGVAAVPLIQGTWQVNPVVSGSMRPGFAVGGVVISERIPVDQLALRDVMVFRSPDNPANLMVHRIVRMTKNKAGELVIRTQGDANNVEDPWTLTISGKYAYVVRWSLPLLGYAAIAYQNHRGLVLLGAGLLLIVIAVTTIFGRERDEEESPDEPEPPKPTRTRRTVSTHAEESPARAEKAEPVHTVPNWQRRDSVIREDAAPVQDNPTDSLSTPNPSESVAASSTSGPASRPANFLEPQRFGIDAERIDGDDLMGPDEPPDRHYWSD